MMKTDDRRRGPDDELARHIRREIEGRAAPVTQAEVTRLGSQGSGPPIIDRRPVKQANPHRVRARLIAVAAAIAVLAGGAAALARRDGGPVQVLMPTPPAPPTEAPSAGGSWRTLPAWPNGGELGSNQNGREDFAAVATGSEVVVWGGRVDGGAVYTDGAMLDTRTNTWRPMADGPVGGRYGTATAWTGHEVVFIGGSNDSTGEHSFTDGAAYDPSTDRWRQIPLSPFSSGLGYRAVWTGTEVVVAGGAGPIDRAVGQQPTVRKNEAAAYNPDTNTWRKLPPLPTDLSFLDMVWSGTEVLVAGGQSFRTESSCCTNGPVLVAALNPSTGTWRTAPASPTSSQAASIAWTGSELLAVPYRAGGDSASTWDPVTNIWTARPLPNGPSCEAQPLAVGIPDGALVLRCGSTSQFDGIGHQWIGLGPPPNTGERPFGFSQRGTVFSAGSVVTIAGDGRALAWTPYP